MGEVEQNTGSVDAVKDFCARKDWIEVAVAGIFQEGQSVTIWPGKRGSLSRGTSEVMAVSNKYRRLYVNQLPHGIQIGDLLTIER